MHRYVRDNATQVLFVTDNWKDGSTCQTCIAFIPRGSRNTSMYLEITQYLI